MRKNEQYSHKDFTGKSLKDVLVEELNSTEIVGSCFYQEWTPGNPVERDIFPKGMSGVTFKRCNLDNVLIPPGNEIDKDEPGRHERIKVQNDMEDWIVDENEKPIEPIAKSLFLQLGLSINPANIPTEFIREEEITQAEFDKVKDSPKFLQWFKSAPQIVDTISQEITLIVQADKWDGSQDKSVWIDRFDKPNKVKIDNKVRTVPIRGKLIAREEYHLSGTITRLKIKGAGHFMLPGLKPRPLLNESITQKKMAELREKEIAGDN